MYESYRNKLCHGIQSSIMMECLQTIKGPIKALKNGLRIGATNVLLIAAVSLVCERQRR